MTLGKNSKDSGRGEEQHNVMFVLRQMVEKRLELQGSLALGFVHLERAYDTVPREMVMATVDGGIRSGGEDG